MDTYSKLEALEAQGKNVFRFPDGIPGFEHIHEFAFRFKPEISPFFFMQTVEEPDIVFVCIDPCLLDRDYSGQINSVDMKPLCFVSPTDDVGVVAIVTLGPPAGDATANLVGPVVINMTTHTCHQVICYGQGLSIRCKILDGLTNMEEKARVENALEKMKGA
jgi:flagellar assembly factor FliW